MVVVVVVVVMVMVVWCGDDGNNDGDGGGDGDGDVDNGRGGDQKQGCDARRNVLKQCNATDVENGIRLSLSLP